MPEYIKAYIVILFLSTFAFYYARKITTPFVTNAEFKEWINTWLVITSFAFFGINFWVFLTATLLYVYIKTKKSTNAVALYMAIIAAVPPITASIPGFGVVNYLLVIDYPMLLSVCLLLVVYANLKPNSQTLKFNKVKTDFFVVSFIIVNIGLSLTDTTFTDTLRQCVILFITTFLPYYAVSRGVQSAEQLKKAMFAYVVTCFPLALVGVFESGKGWLLYLTIEEALKQNWVYGGYLMRGDGLRASSSFGHSIMFGYGMVVALGFYLLLQTQIKNKLYKMIGFGIISAGLVAALARGPWVGAAVLICVFLYLGKNGISNLMKLGMASMMTLALVSATPVGDKVINLLPFVGKTDKFNVDYRAQLVEASFAVVAKSPLFGNKNFDKEPEMQKMIQGEHIIDIVNQYVNVLLNSGILGLTLFLGIFISALIYANSAMKRVQYNNRELYDIGRTLIATLVAIMFMISAVADQLIIPYLYFSCIGLCIAYAEIVRRWIIQSLDAPTSEHFASNN